MTRLSVTCRRCRVWTWIETPEGSGTAVLTCPACGYGIMERVIGRLPLAARQEASDVALAIEGESTGSSSPGAPLTQEDRPLGASPAPAENEAGALLCAACSGLTTPVLVGGKVVGQQCLARCHSRSGRRP